MEEWRDIKGYEGLYQVSNLGRVKSLARKINNQYGKKERLMTQKIDKDGYKRVGLNKNGKQIYYGVHRLVAQAFISNPNNYPQINHKDENKSNNKVDNLEWCDGKYNQNYGTINERRTQKLKKKVICITTGEKFDSIIEASEKYNIKNKSDISRVCKGKRNYCGNLNGKKLEWGYIYE